MHPIYVVNNFGQFNHLILRMLRDNDIDAKMIKNDVPVAEVAESCRGIILGGGPDISRAGNAPTYVDAGLPVLGICLGLHIISTARGGTIRPGASGGFGGIEVTIQDHDTILAGYPDTISVWASHGDEVADVPEGFRVLATSPICGVEAMAHETEPIYGIQWHPEVSHSVDGCRVYENFNALTLERA